jgi:hypothetical protein
MGQGDVRRVTSVFDLPDASLRCAALGRHVGFGAEDPRVRDVTGWPGHRAAEVHYTCDCGRWKRETIDQDTGETLTRGAEYGGGVLLWLGSSPSRDEARAVYLARVRARADGKGTPNQGGVTRLNDRRSS